MSRLTGTGTFTTTHFSYYGVGFNKISFSDVPSGIWYEKAVSFLAARKITSGTGGGKYNPNESLTRGQFITLMMRAYGIAPVDNPMDNFSEAGNTYYTGYLAAAKQLDISQGVGNNQFAPEQVITRQEMFTILYNALKVIGRLPDGNSGKAITDFSDSGGVSSYAREATVHLVKVGVVSGDNDLLFPTATITRAQMAQVLYKLLSK